ncbi:MAG TPA: tocopherol cyclase family protein [Bacteroidales bacterium]|nr:tocopherol cyclase family protein [Bacteroidales bacterium]
MKLFHPEVFQGSLQKNHYFEGWYLKHVSPDLKHVFSFIPGVSLTRNDPHAFIQVINGVSGKSWYARYPVSDFQWHRKHFWVQVGRSVFSREGSDINISTGGVKIIGQITYENSVTFPSSLLSPGIMGWYSFVPYMECKHGVVSADHHLGGALRVDGETVGFTGGKGYIEKDWGTSFPAAWIWLHSNTFIRDEASVMLSIARIPWMGSYFMGFLCFLYVEGRFHLFSTYNGSRIIGAVKNGKDIDIHLSGKKQHIFFHIHPKKSGMLRAPEHGEMKRKIKESVDSNVMVRLEDNAGRILFMDEGVRTGLEVTEHIFDLLAEENNAG